MAPVRPFTLPRLLLPIALVVGLALTVTASDVAPSQEPDVDFESYLRRLDGRVADPVNLVFAGEGDAVAVALRLGGMLCWGPVSGEEMAFSVDGKARWTEVQLGSQSGLPGIRRHIRIAGGAGVSESWGPYVLAAVHRDESLVCGHVGVGFNEERNAVATAMADAGYRVSWIWLGNSGPVEHCDGVTTRGDGWAAVIHLQKASGAAPSPSATPAPAVPEPSSSPAAVAAATSAPTPAPSPSPTPSPTPAPAPSPAPLSDFPPIEPFSFQRAGGRSR